MQTKELLSILNGIAPFETAEDYDNVGLLVGSEKKEVKSVLLALDLTERVLDEALEKKTDAIITHHPLLFHSIKRIDTETTEGKIFSRLIKNDISYIALHTNMDKAKGGLNDYLANLTGIKNPTVFEDGTKACMISVYVPKSAVENVKKAMLEAGAGEIGNYSGCCFESKGAGSFVPNNDARPYKGTANKEEHINEHKLEMICFSYAKARVIEAMLNAHPYEQPVYSAVETVYKGEYGFGRKGELEKPMTLKEYCGFVKEVLNLPVLEYTGKDDKLIKTVGVCSGAGGDMYEQALALGLDAFITGDIKHHIGVLAAQNKTALINGGHYGTEVIFKNILCKHLQKRFNELQYDVNIICSSSEKSPWIIL